MIFTKGANQSAKFQEILTAYMNLPNLYFGGLLLFKVYAVSVKKIRENICLMILKIDGKFEEKLICCFKIDKNLVNFDPSTQKFPKFALGLVPFVQSIQSLT